VKIHIEKETILLRACIVAVALVCMLRTFGPHANQFALQVHAARHCRRSLGAANSSKAPQQQQQ
jgi:hypothetical protein